MKNMTLREMWDVVKSDPNFELIFGIWSGTAIGLLAGSVLCDMGVL